MSLSKAIAFYHSIAIEGGYVYHYSLDLKEKWGEGKTDDFTIEVQAPGTPAVGESFLRAFKVTGKQEYLNAAKDAAYALIKGQNELGGWEHKIYFNRPLGTMVSFDDNQTQGAISFLMALDQEIDDTKLDSSIAKALEMMVRSQLDHGGWPHRYPEQHNYHDFATFNDQGINDCIRVMLEASKYYDDTAFEQSLHKAGRFLILSQLPPPQPGWAQQYNAYLQPAWARSFEPPSVCPQVTLHNINTLLDLFEFSNERIYLEPIHDALRWLRESQLPNGKWGRFLEIGTNKPLYYDRDRIRVNSLEELSLERRTGYGYEIDIANNLMSTKSRFDRVFHSALTTSEDDQVGSHAVDYLQLEEHVKEIIASLDQHGRWIASNDKFRAETPGERWNGQYRTEDRISSALFNKNIATLCQFLESNKN
ncbi:MAG: hypothetical protein HKN76_19220 [Saprospiraceae bacterium]|nr:hypothetical protein [Saprospiraceae bacterium]